MLSLFANPLVVILLLTALVSGALGKVIYASIIVVIVLFNVGLNFIQTYRAQSLSHGPTAPTNIRSC